MIKLENNFHNALCLRGEKGMGIKMKRLASLILGIILCITVSGCGAAGTDKAYPVKFDEAEVMVGETAASVLLDAGFELKEISGTELTADTPVEKNAYYTGINVVKDDATYAMISLAVEGKETTLSNALVAQIIVKPELGHVIDRISFDGVPLPEVTAEVFKEHVAGSTIREDGTRAFCAGDNYTSSIYYEDGKVTEMEMTRHYSVQWGT